MDKAMAVASKSMAMDFSIKWKPFFLDPRLPGGEGKDKKPPETHDERVEELLKAHSHHLGQLKGRDAFLSWDKDGDGIIEKQEFRKAQRALGLPGYEALKLKNIDTADDECMRAYTHRDVPTLA